MNFNRKQFLHLTLSSAALAALGCSSDSEGGAGTGGSGSGSGGSTSTGGTSGSSGGATGSTGGSGSGTGGTSASSGGTGSGSGGTDGSGGSASGGSASGGTGGTDVCTEDIVSESSLGARHTHTAILTAAMLASGDAVVIRSDGRFHQHCVALSAADIATIKAGGVVKVKTCGDDEDDHEFVFGCGSSVPAPVFPSCGSTELVGEGNECPM